MKKQESIYMTCPFCGEVIGKSAGTDDTEIKCPECKKRLIINYRNKALLIRESEVTYKASL